MPACGQHPGKHDLCQPLGTQTTTVAQPVDPEAWVVPLYFLSLLVCVSGLVGGRCPQGWLRPSGKGAVMLSPWGPGALLDMASLG